jgi:hypothetical protein
MRILSNPWAQGGPYIGYTGYSGTFELSAIELLDRSFQVIGSLKFDNP